MTESVSNALVETGNSDVIKTMLDNSGAEISARTLEFLVDQSKTIDSYQNPLLHRKDLGSDLARRMYWWVSAALRKHITDAFNLSTEEIEEFLENAVDHVVLGEAAENNVNKGTALAGQLNQEKRLLRIFWCKRSARRKFLFSKICSPNSRVCVQSWCGGLYLNRAVRDWRSPVRRFPSQKLNSRRFSCLVEAPDREKKSSIQMSFPAFWHFMTGFSR